MINDDGNDTTNNKKKIMMIMKKIITIIPITAILTAAITISIMKITMLNKNIQCDIYIFLTSLPSFVNEAAANS